MGSFKFAIVQLHNYNNEAQLTFLNSCYVHTTADSTYKLFKCSCKKKSYDYGTYNNNTLLQFEVSFAIQGLATTMGKCSDRLSLAPFYLDSEGTG